MAATTCVKQKTLEEIEEFQDLVYYSFNKLEFVKQLEFVKNIVRVILGNGISRIFLTPFSSKRKTMIHELVMSLSSSIFHMTLKRIKDVLNKKIFISKFVDVYVIFLIKNQHIHRFFYTHIIVTSQKLSNNFLKNGKSRCYLSKVYLLILAIKRFVKL